MKVGHPPVKKPDPAQASSSSAAASDAAAKAAPAAAATAIPATADASAKIAISSSATQLLSGNSHADFDAEKVAKISKSIDDGSFKVNPEAIADKLISNAKEVLTKS